jgi:AcrR family transcriptional regulator
MLAKATKESTRALLLQCAKVVFAERGYHAAGVADIIAAARVARGTFYLYFESKRQVFDEILEDFLDKIDRQIVVIDIGPAAPPPLEQLRANLERVLALVLEDRHLIEILAFQASGLNQDGRRRLDLFYHRILAQIEAALRRGMMLGLVRTCDARITAAAILGAVQGIAARVALEQDGYHRERIVDEILAFGLHGVLAPPPHDHR